MSSGRTSLAKLPPGVLQIIMLQLVSSDLISFATTCGRFMHLLLDKRFMRRLMYRNLYFGYWSPKGYSRRGCLITTRLPNIRNHGCVSAWYIDDNIIPRQVIIYDGGALKTIVFNSYNLLVDYYTAECLSITYYYSRGFVQYVTLSDKANRIAVFGTLGSMLGSELCGVYNLDIEIVIDTDLIDAINYNGLDICHLNNLLPYIQKYICVV